MKEHIITFKSVIKNLAKKHVIINCSNCGEEDNGKCACFRNKCKDCGKPVWNITFTICDKCWIKNLTK